MLECIVPPLIAGDQQNRFPQLVCGVFLGESLIISVEAKGPSPVLYSKFFGNHLTVALYISAREKLNVTNHVNISLL